MYNDKLIKIYQKINDFVVKVFIIVLYDFLQCNCTEKKVFGETIIE